MTKRNGEEYRAGLPVKIKLIRNPSDNGITWRGRVKNEHQEAYAVMIWYMQEKWGFTYDEAVFRAMAVRSHDGIEWVHDLFGMSDEEWLRVARYMDEEEPPEMMAEVRRMIDLPVIDTYIEFWFRGAVLRLRRTGQN